MPEHNYAEKLQPVITASRFTIDAGTYVYASVQTVSNAEKHLMVVRDGTEITVVTEMNNLPLEGHHQLNKDKWKLVNIRCGNPFYCVGFIALITGVLASAGIDIVLISSFSNDLILVMEKDFDDTVRILKDTGFKQQ